MNSPQKPVAFTVPPLIRKNTALIALSQSFTGAGMQLAYGLGPLMVYQLTGSAGLSGLSVALIGLIPSARSPTPMGACPAFSSGWRWRCLGR